MTAEIGKYSELTAAILQTIISGGLRRQTLSAENLFEALPHLAKNLEEFDDMFVDTMIWLRNEGYIRCDEGYEGTEGESCFDAVAPTSRCLAAMEVKIEALGGMTAGQVLTANKSGEVSASNYVKAGSLFGGLFGGLIKSLS